MQSATTSQPSLCEVQQYLFLSLFIHCGLSSTSGASWFATCCVLHPHCVRVPPRLNADFWGERVGPRLLGCQKDCRHDESKIQIITTSQWSLCCWPKCELVTQLIFSFKTISCNLIEFSMKKMLKFQSLSHTLGLNSLKSPSLNPTH